MHELGDAEGVVIDDGIFIIFRHRAVNVFGEGLDGFFSDEGFVVFVRNALSAITVAGGTVFGVDDRSLIPA